MVMPLSYMQNVKRQESVQKDIAPNLQIISENLGDAHCSPHELGCSPRVTLVSWPGEGGGQGWGVVVVIQLAGDELLHVRRLGISGGSPLFVSLLCHLHSNFYTHFPQPRQTWIDPAIWF